MFVIIREDIDKTIRTLAADNECRTAVKTACIILCQEVVDRMNVDRENPVINEDVVTTICDEVLTKLFEGDV